MKLRLMILGLIFVAFGCGEDRMPVVADPTVKEEAAPKPALELIDISKVPPLDVKARFQEGKTGTGEPNQVAKDLVANGKGSIPFLIGKLDDETEIDHRIENYWGRLYVGDLALIILTDFFTERDLGKSAIPGFRWDEFLEKGNDKELTGEAVLRRYIEKHGRKEIRQRWQQVWDQNKEKIFWDAKCSCFRMGK
jgi:hypothetical protein